jgi:RNA polymerase sigma-70 factor (ECF subfamily)
MSAGAVQDPLELLVGAARAGDAVALDRLLAQCRPRVLRICQRVLPCQQDAEDACQDALLLVASKLQTFDGRAKFTTWLHAVAVNSARSTYRRMRRVAQDVPLADRLDLAVDPRTTSVIAGTRLDLLEALDRLERGSGKAATAVVLRDLGDLTYSQIAETMDAPEGTVKSWVHEGRKQLRASLRTA